MAKKKAQKKKKQVARAKSAPKKAATTTAQKAPKKAVKAEAVEASAYVESDSNAADSLGEKRAGTVWDWRAWAGLALAVGIILFAGWLVVRSVATESETLKSGVVTPVPIEGTANPQQLQAGGDTSVQNGAAPAGEGSSDGSGLQKGQSLTPEQLKNLQQ